jgi:hypothetical protein
VRKVVTSRIPELGLIMTGMIFGVVITMMGHVAYMSYSPGEFDIWGLRPSFDTIDPADQKLISNDQLSDSSPTFEE